jgi:N6-adenosine-specific RNA methylase IME4
VKFRTVILDYPWFYADAKKERKDGAGPTRGIGACHHYDQMTVQEGIDMADLVNAVAADRCHLYMWATMPLLPDALKIMDAWEFKYSTVAFAWIKMNSKRWEDAVETVLQAPLFPVDGDSVVTRFLDALTFFGPGFYTGSNIELVLLGTKGQPFKHADGCKASQIVYAPLGEHSAKPDEVQRRIEWMYPDATPRLEMFARRDRPGWVCVGNEAPGTTGEDIRDSLGDLR